MQQPDEVMAEDAHVDALDAVVVVAVDVDTILLAVDLEVLVAVNGDPEVEVVLLEEVTRTPQFIGITMISTMNRMNYDRSSVT